MNTLSIPETERIPSDVMSDLQAVIAAVAEGKPIDPEVQKRVRDEADRNREAIYERHGLLDIGVPAIRELRDS